jgi:hypothetical protein
MARSIGSAVYCSNQDARGCLDDCAVPREAGHMPCRVAGKLALYTCLYALVLPVVLTAFAIWMAVISCMYCVSCRRRLTPSFRSMAKPPGLTQIFQRGSYTNMW